MSPRRLSLLSLISGQDGAGANNNNNNGSIESDQMQHKSAKKHRSKSKKHEVAVDISMMPSQDLDFV
jgi:hypothetical protein